MLLGSETFKNCSIFLIDNLPDVLEELSDSTYYLDEQHRLEIIDRDALLSELRNGAQALNTDAPQSPPTAGPNESQANASANSQNKAQSTQKIALDSIDLKIDVTKEIRTIATLWRYVKSTYSALSCLLWILNLLLISYMRSKMTKQLLSFNQWPAETRTMSYWIGYSIFWSAHAALSTFVNYYIIYSSHIESFARLVDSLHSNLLRAHLNEFFNRIQISQLQSIILGQSRDANYVLPCLTVELAA